MSICISKANAPLAFEVIQIHVSGESRGRLWLTSSNLWQNFQIFNWFYSILHYSTLYRPLFACLVFAFFENHQDAMTWCISSSPERRRQMSRVHRPTQLSIKGKQQSTTLVAHVFAATWNGLNSEQCVRVGLIVDIEKDMTKVHKTYHLLLIRE